MITPSVSAWFFGISTRALPTRLVTIAAPDSSNSVNSRYWWKFRM